MAFAPLTLSTLALVLSNLVPLAGVVAGWWTVYEILLLFWAENIVIGLYQLARMGLVLVGRREAELLILMPFFCIHYGGFALGHGLVLASFLGPGAEPDLGAGVAMLVAPGGLLFAVLALAASHGFSFVVNFWAGGEWRQVTPGRLMSQPYARVVLLHVVLIAGAALVKGLGEPMAALALLVGLKIGVDVVVHRREHRVLRGALPPSTPSRQGAAAPWNP